MRRQGDPEAPRCGICDRRLQRAQVATHENWHAALDAGRIPADTPDPIPDRSWVAPYARAVPGKAAA